MDNQQLELSGAVPDGWISVEPAVVNEDVASIVLLRSADLSRPFTTNITVSELAFDTAEELADVAADYAKDLSRRMADVTVLRRAVMSETPREYAQELSFTLELSGQPITIKQSQFLFETPAENSSAALVLQVLYSAPTEVYDVARSAVAEFLESVTAGVGGGVVDRDADLGPGVPKARLEASVRQILEESVGQQSDGVVCNGGLRAEVGAVQRCALVVGNEKLGVTVTATRVVGNDVKFDVQVDQQPMV
jgi:hypothetical protein